MKRYISNYTIIPSGDEFINHIVTVDDNGRLVSIDPFDRELGNTHYVPSPIVVAPSNYYNKVEEAFMTSSTRELFKMKLATMGLCDSITAGTVIVAALDFKTRTIKQL